MKKRLLRKPKLFILAVTSALLLVILIGTRWDLLRPKTAFAWFDDTFSFRQKITIGNTGSADTNKKVKLDIDTAALTTDKLQADCDDIRFTDSNGRVLEYYLDASGGACDTASTDFYVLLPVINAGDTVLYMYYGNPLAQASRRSVQFSEDTFSPTSGPTAASEEKGPSPLAHWKFDEGQDNSCPPGLTSDVCDATTNRNDGANTAATWQAESACVNGKCLYFSGTNAYVTVTDANTLDITDTSDFSLSLWVKFSELSTDRALLFKKSTQDAASAGYALFYNATGGVLDFRVSDGTDQFIVTSSTFTITDQWVQITAVYDDDSATNSTIYVNGISVKASTTGTIGNVNSLANSTDLTIGTQGNGSADFQGFIDDVQIYPYVRTTAQAKAAALPGSRGGVVLGLGQSDVLSNGLVGYWNMDDLDIDVHSCLGGGTGDLCDLSGNGHHGTDAGTMTDSDYVNGKFGSSLNFDGSDDAMQVDTLVNSVNTNQGTISFWMYRTFADSDAGYPSPFTIGNSGNLYHEIGLYYDSGSDQFKAHYGASDVENAEVVMSAATIPQNQWVHFSMTWDKEKDVLMVYLNGEYHNQDTEIPSSITLDRADIGAVAIDDCCAFEGNLDEVRVYNRALSSAEVKKLSNWAPGPIGHWKLDENSGGTAYDSSGNGFTGTWTGTGSTRWKPGKFGSAGNFNGSNDQISSSDISSKLNLKSTTPPSFTVAAWFYKDNNTDGGDLGGVLLTTNTASGNVRLVYRKSVDLLGFQLLAGSTYVSVSPGYGKWIHAAGVYDAGSNLISLYINGAFVQSATPISTNLSGINTTAVTIGNAQDNYAGKIDDVRVYNYARSPAQIVEDMNAGHPPGGSPVGSPLIQYAMNELQGQTVSNTGNGGSTLNGTLGLDSSSASDDPAWLSGASCKNNACLDFDGSADYVSLPDNALDAYSTGSICSWVYYDEATDAGNQGAIFTYSDDASLNYKHSFYISDTGSDNTVIRAVLRTNTSSNQIDYYTANNAISRQQWNHVCFVQDGTGVDLYVNGQATTFTSAITGTATLADWFDDIASNAERATIGNIRDNSPDSFLNGRIDDFQLFTVALTAEQVGIVMNANSALSSGVLGSSEASQLADGAGNAPVAYWSFDEGSGLSAIDKSGNSYSGTLTNGPVWVPGRFGSGLRFNGNNTVVTTSINPIDETATYTYSFWVYPYSLALDDTLFMTYNNDWAISLGNSNDIVLYNASAGGNPGSSNANALSANRWQHVVITYDGSGVCRFYVNGSNVTSDGSCGETSFVDNLRIGAYHTTGGGVFNAFDGVIDEIKVYNYVRTPAQIAYDYSRGAPVVHWKLNDCQGTTVQDASGNGYTGTLTVGGSGTQTAAGTCQSSGAWANGANGILGSSLNFDTSDDYVDFGDLSFTEGVSQLSWSLWYNPGSSVASGGCIFCKRNASTEVAWSIGTYVNGSSSSRPLMVAIAANASSCCTGFAVTYGSDYLNVINANTWHHIVVVYGTTSGSLEIYVNGKLYPYLVFNASPPSQTLSTNANARLNAYAAGTNYSGGKIDDVRIYNYPLSADQVSQIMNENAALRFAPPTGSP